MHNGVMLPTGVLNIIPMSCRPSSAPANDTYGDKHPDTNPVKNSESHPIELDEKSLREISESARFLVVVFLQNLKAFRLYEPNHPILSKFFDRLWKTFNRYFNEFDVFSLQIKEHQLLHRKKIIYENSDMKESLAFLFFRDGIREIRFHKGLEISEIVEFLNIVKKGDRVNRLRDDLVTLIWQANFPHIDITSIEDFLERGETLIPVDKGLMDQGTGFRAGSSQKLEPDVSNALLLEDFAAEETASPEQSLIEACQLNLQEMERIDAETQQEERPDLFSLVDDLIEILLHLSEEMDAYENLIGYFEQVFLKFFEWGEVRRVVGILNNLNGILETMELREKQVFAIRRILEIPSGAEFVDHLGSSLKLEKADPESTLQMLQLLTRQALQPLVLLYQQLRPGKWKVSVRDQIVELSKDDIEPLVKLLPGSKLAGMVQVLDLLGQVKHPSTIRHLYPCVRHENSGVREATLKLLRKFEERGIPLIEKFLTDPEPKIRGKAALILSQLAREQAVKPLSQIIFSQDFHKRDYQEKASFMRALGETGSGEALSLLKKISKKGRWLRREKWREMKRCAEMTLKTMEGYASLKKAKGFSGDN
jgi:HEAT repeat protein